MAEPRADVTLSVRVSKSIVNKLEKLADATDRTKSFLAAQAIESFLETQAWQIEGIENALKQAKSKNAHFIEHEAVVYWLNSWGTKNEKAPPK